MKEYKEISQVQKLQDARNLLLDAIAEMDPDASKVEIYEMHGQINAIDAKLHAINPSLV